MAARRLAELDPELAQDHFERMAGRAETDDIPWLGLFWTTREADPETALEAAVQAIARATAEADQDTYEEVATFLEVSLKQSGARNAPAAPGDAR